MYLKYVQRTKSDVKNTVSAFNMTIVKGAAKENDNNIDLFKCLALSSLIPCGPLNYNLVKLMENVSKCISLPRPGILLDNYEEGHIKRTISISRK